jgi:hypothetical protein
MTGVANALYATRRQGAIYWTYEFFGQLLSCGSGGMGEPPDPRDRNIGIESYELIRLRLPALSPFLCSLRCRIYLCDKGSETNGNGSSKRMPAVLVDLRRSLRCSLLDPGVYERREVGCQ